MYDQSGHGNHLGQRHMLVNASKHKILVGGKVPVCTCSSPFASSLGASQKLLRLHVMYSDGMWIDPGYGYHVDNTSGLATGAEEESIYAVMSGTHYNQHCCFVRAPPPPTAPLALVR